MVEEK